MAAQHVNIICFLATMVAIFALPVDCLSFTIDYDKNTFLKDGQPFRYISGSMHYSRVPSVYWRDRLTKLRYAGLNAVQTYVPWNFHEPFPGVYNFDGDRDLVSFLKTAQDVGLLVVLRAGPYICAEWEMGGLPSWLLREKDIVLRSNDSQYLSFVDKWMSQLLALVKPLLYENGGPVITVQVENEYGSYATCQPSYLKRLEEIFRNYLGPNVILFTTDGAGDNFLKCGALPSLFYTTVDFGATDDPESLFKFQREYEPHGPLVNSEFYTGWLDHWGEPHQRRDGNQIASSLDKILQLNASVNMYMFEGGTNFGFWNGANSGGSSYQPQPTSYDYDAPLSECGNMTEKFHLIRNVIGKYSPLPSDPPPPQPNISVYGDSNGAVYFTHFANLFSSTELFTRQSTSYRPLTFEDMQQDYGFILYSTVGDVQVDQSTSVTLTIGELHDRACIYWNQMRVGTLQRKSGVAGNLSVSFKVASSSGSIDILVENMGRVNYGSFLPDRKGILNGVYLNGREILNWKTSSLPLNNTEKITFVAVAEGVAPATSAVFYRATFEINGTAPRDAFIRMNEWSKGVAFINNFNLGRYWPAVGPQRTLYVPASCLVTGVNDLVLFELDNADSDNFAQFEPKADLNWDVYNFTDAERRYN